MELGSLLFSLIIILLAWAAFSKLYYKLHTRPEEIYFAETADGWKIAVCRYRPPTPKSGTLPVVLAPGLGANRFSFDPDSPRSLARYLSSQGHDTWIFERRGSGLSERGGIFKGKPYGWNFEDYVQLDAPAALSKILEVTGKTQLHWIGHSMGGILAFGVLSHPKTASMIRSAVTLGSALDYSGTASDFKKALKLRALLDIFPALPLGFFSLLFAPLLGRLSRKWDEFHVWPENTHMGTMRRILANGYNSVSTPVLAQLATVLESGGLRHADGQPYAQGLAQATTPVFLIGGDHDHQCPPEAVQNTYEKLKNVTHKKIRIFGGSSGPEKEHYGHFDLLIGNHVTEEVYPEILKWLEDNR